ncbi:hypothetical protein F7725_026121 [Dissostichus mawsoni]|uniref:Uncharacterized protein n=1 Tax=Dissostichus mawsoni TaxID=36200 RepID=A0A7J5X660_DISMA|nr:hypothetical protein F7725_026121 [Dissostichus mawsoni]
MGAIRKAEQAHFAYLLNVPVSSLPPPTRPVDCMNYSSICNKQQASLVSLSRTFMKGAAMVKRVRACDHSPLLCVSLSFFLIQFGWRRVHSFSLIGLHTMNILIPLWRLVIENRSWAEKETVVKKERKKDMSQTDLSWLRRELGELEELQKRERDCLEMVKEQTAKVYKAHRLHHLLSTKQCFPWHRCACMYVCMWQQRISVTPHWDHNEDKAHWSLLIQHHYSPSSLSLSLSPSCLCDRPRHHLAYFLLPTSCGHHLIHYDIHNFQTFHYEVDEQWPFYYLMVPLMNKITFCFTTPNGFEYVILFGEENTQKDIMCPGVFNSPFRPAPHEMELLLRQVKYQTPTRLAPSGKSCLLGMPGPAAQSYPGTLGSPLNKTTGTCFSPRPVLPPIATKKQQMTLDESRDPLKVLLKKNDIIKTWQTALWGATAQSRLVSVMHAGSPPFFFCYHSYTPPLPPRCDNYLVVMDKVEVLAVEVVRPGHRSRGDRSKDRVLVPPSISPPSSSLLFLTPNNN